MQEVGEHGVKTFEADGFVLKDCGDVVGGDEGILKRGDHEAAMRRAGHEVEFGGKHGDAGAFAADERSRDLEAVFRKQEVEVVSGDAARDFRKALADERRVFVANGGEGAVDFSAAASG